MSFMLSDGDFQVNVNVVTVGQFVLKCVRPYYCYFFIAIVIEYCTVYDVSF